MRIRSTIPTYLCSCGYMKGGEAVEKKYMSRALDLAKLGKGFVNPNPLVGAVIVKEGKVIGEGYHKQYGEPHAEINAFNNAVDDVSQSEMYVTLEPCSHYGKTPPCVDEIIKRNIKKIVIAMKDPNPLVSGRGIKKLKEHGIEVVVGLKQKEAQKMNEVFIKYITTQLPFCTLKTAMTLDGKIATYTGDSKWITNQTSRAYVHMLRQETASIMVGIGTVTEDNPNLTTRLENMSTRTRNPLRIIVDSSGRIPLSSNVLYCDENKQTIIVVTEKAKKEKIRAIEQHGAKVIVAPHNNHQVDVSYLMKYLGEIKIDSVLLEGGSTLNFSMLKAGLVDKVMVFLAPKILGGSTAKTPVGGQGFPKISDCIALRDMTVKKYRDDLMVEAYI